MFCPGAGAGATASVVVADILNIVAVLKTDKDQKSAGAKKTLHPLFLACISTTCDRLMEELVTRFYARFLTRPPRCDWQIGYMLWQSRR